MAGIATRSTFCMMTIHMRPAVVLFCLAMLAGPLVAADSRPGPTGAQPLFAEDFESGMINKDVWSLEVNGGNIVQVQQDKAAHGRYALKVSCPAPANKTWAFVTASHLPEALKQHQYGRVYMFVAPRLPLRHTILIMSGTPGFPFNKFEEVATANGRWQLTYVSLRPSGNEEDYHSGGAIPVDRWFCLEWEFNDNPSHAAVWIDGKPVYESNFVSKSTGATSNLVGGFTDLAFGFRLWGAAPEAFDVYYDDIAIDSKPIGQIAEQKAP
jgi:hypothetical protein